MEPNRNSNAENFNNYKIFTRGVQQQIWEGRRERTHEPEKYDWYYPVREGENKKLLKNGKEPKTFVWHHQLDQRTYYGSHRRERGKLFFFKEIIA